MKENGRGLGSLVDTLIIGVFGALIGVVGLGAVLVLSGIVVP